MRLRGLAIIAVALAGLALPGGIALGEDTDTVSGEVRVLDADILAFGTQRVILWGVDAPERSQYCLAGTSKYSCYDAAMRGLETLIGSGAVSCTLLGDPDPFNRRHGVCTAGDTELNAELVRLGLALAYLEQSEDYVAAQEEAKAAGVGLWQAGVEFDEPWVWRKQRTPGGFR